MSWTNIPKGLPPDRIWLPTDTLSDALNGLRQLYIALSACSDPQYSEEFDEV